MKTKLILISVVCIFLCGCAARKPIANQRPDNNPSYGVQYLFEHDGVRVYRFFEAGNRVYFTSPGTVVTAIANDSTKHRTVTITGQE